MLWNFLGIAMGTLIVIGCLLAIVLDVLTQSSEHVVTITNSPNVATEDGVQDIKVLNTTLTSTINFTQTFRSKPSVLSSEINGPGTITSFVVNNVSSATAELEFPHFPFDEPNSKIFFSSTCVGMSCFLDSLGKLWFAALEAKEADYYLVYRCAIDGYQATTLTTKQEVSSAISEGTTSWFETKDGNILLVASTTNDGCVGVYGSVAGTILSETIMITPDYVAPLLHNTFQQTIITSNPNDHSNLYIILRHDRDARFYLTQSTDFGKNFTTDELVYTVIGEDISLFIDEQDVVSPLLFYNDGGALIVITISEVIPIYYNGSTFVARAAIPFVGTGKAIATKFDDVIAILHFSDSTSDHNIHIVFATNTEGTGWTSPVFIGAATPNNTGNKSLLDVYAGSTGTIPWIIVRLANVGIYGLCCDTADGKGVWSEAILMRELTNTTKRTANVNTGNDLLFVQRLETGKVFYDYGSSLTRLTWSIKG